MEEYWLWLCTAPGMYQPYIAALTGQFQNPENLFRAPADTVRKAAGVPEAQKEQLLAHRKNWDPGKTIHELEKKRIRFISIDNPGYPEKLGVLSDPPYGLFIKGELPDPRLPAVAVVGARRCSSYGREKAARIGTLLARSGVQVLSGMALGVDGASQRAALAEGGKSFAVLGCGVDICYPRDNIGLYDSLSRQGGIISEYTPGLSPASWHFPFRNRLISGLSDCVVVVEAREKSGSLITADLAADQGKDVLVVPGRMEDPLSRGCNKLIAQGACILWEEEELFRCLEIPFPGPGNPKKENLGLAKKENLVYSGVDFHDRSLEAILMSVPLPRAEVLEALVSLELKGLVKETAKNHYVRVQTGGRS